MNEHVNAWLGAYIDGELHGRRLRQVETHLTRCGACRLEFGKLRTLSAVLQESPAASDLLPPEQFVAQVGLRLSRRPARPPVQRALRTGWQLIPAALFGVWVFIQAASITTGIMSVGVDLGLGGEQAMILLSGIGGGSCLNELLALSQVNIGQIASCVWELTSYLALPAVIGLLYWSWLAVWWVRRQHRQPQVG